jgi:hypothetical protein
MPRTSLKATQRLSSRAAISADTEVPGSAGAPVSRHSVNRLPSNRIRPSLVPSHK